MDAGKTFALKELALIGILSGVTVSIVKLIQAGFYLGDEVPAVEFQAALLTYVGYMVLGAIGAIIFVDHDSKGQKMLKSAFLMGLVAPSLFLALVNQPITTRTNLHEMLQRVPKITDLFIARAYAQEGGKPDSQGIKDIKSLKSVYVLDKAAVQPSFADAVWKALGRGMVPTTYTYVVGTTDDASKALATASTVNRMLSEYKGSLSAKVVQPRGQQDFYVTVGELGTPDKAAMVGEWTKEAAIRGLRSTESEEAKRAAGLMIKGQVVDARAMFTKD